MTHDYKRNGTTTLFAALNVLDGTVIGRNMQRHRHQEFIRFLTPSTPRCRPARSSTSSSTTTPLTRHPRVRAWLDRHQRFTFHFTPTSCSWLNAVEASSPSCRGVASSAASSTPFVDLQAAINRFLAEHNQQPKPFTWTADPDKIIAAVKRGHQVLDFDPLATGINRGSRPSCSSFK